MCGICGLIYTDPEHPTSKAVLHRMNDTIRHRGPDDDGIHTDGSAGLAMRRLSIIDVAGGHQPIGNENGRVVIVFNGEIYNYRALRDELIAKGHVFATNSYTETIVHAYEEYGEDCVPKLNGMFAFAIWDARKRRLFIARDRLGIKPLYYSHTPDCIVFGSEIKPLLASGEVAVELDYEGLYHYLTYLYIPAPATIYTQIKKLPPGHTLTWEAGHLTIRPYWDYIYQIDPTITENEALERLDVLLQDAVRIRLMSEVPLSAFLSGGVDSSSVVAYMTRAMDRPVETFSIGFPVQGPYNEAPDARRVAGHLGTNHHEMTVDPDAVHLMEEIAYFMDEPMADSSVVPTYLLSKFTRERVTVALAGDGGDELFAGYERYLPVQAALRYEKLPGAIRKGLIRPLLNLIPEVEQNDALTARLRRVMGDLDRGYETTFLRWITNFNRNTVARLCSPDLQERFRVFNPYTIAQRYMNDTDVPLNRLLRFETKAYLPDDLLMKVDRMSMAHSLEVRVPLIDYRVVEFAATLPVEMKLKGFTTKALFKKLAARYLPQETVRKPKQGFTPPLREWFRGPLGSFARDILLDDTARHRGFFVPKQGEAMIDAHRRGERSFHHQLWVLLTLEMWNRRFLDKR
ncbi:MAG: asparagine synthase (glutamine-hydrolyzing) [candidate division Zixibacteria bacterium]|nr:asparagine synthase (glutamine-hydrolyzing) [candidate division Zixibacteria bacterium]